MKHSNELRLCLERLDIHGLRALWKSAAPHLPQVESDADALICAHAARTSANSIPLKMRAYSHRWLCERNIPSQLPDHLKQSAERLYPRIADSVGVSVNATMPELKPIAAYIQDRISDAVAESYADGVKEPALVTLRMQEARVKARAYVFGRFTAEPPIAARI